MTAPEIQPSQLIEIDGRILTEGASGLVLVQLDPPDQVPVLSGGDAVAFRPLTSDAGPDRFLGTVVAASGGGEVTLLLDRVAMTLALTTEDQVTTQFSPQPNTNEWGNRYY